MSVKINSVPREESSAFYDRNYDPKAIDLLNPGFGKSAPAWANIKHEQVVLSAVRVAMREEACDKIPRVVGAIWLDTPDRWGNDLIVEVEYAKRGWLACFGGHYVEGSGQIKWTCYMD